MPGADASVPNSVLRVISDAQGGLCHLNLQYLDWLALQLLPDTAEHEWLDRHGDIWLKNSDDTVGRKMATFANGIAEFTGFAGNVVPAFTQLEGGAAETVTYETLNDIMIGVAPTPGAIRALDGGVIGNQPAGTKLGIINTPDNIDSSATVVELSGGVDTESDEDLRFRVLSRIRQPPQGGAKHDYENWALSVPGVTRAWCAPNEMGMGTVTVRFMMDELRADNDGFPLASDIAVVTAHLDQMRPVAVKDIWVLSPIPHPIDFFVERLVPNSASVKADIEQNIEAMLRGVASPGQTIYAAWKYAAIMDTANVQSFHLAINDDDIMPSPGHMAVLGDISFF